MTNIPAHILNAKLLIVDDNASNVMLLSKLLENRGYTNIHGVTDPREVEALYKQERHDLILLDIRMPHLDGYQVLEKLRALCEGDDYPPVMILTAQTDQETRYKALEAGAQDFLNKPFDQIEAMTRIRNLIEIRLLHNQVREQNMALDRKVKERTRELEETRLEVVRRLGAAAEYKDNETGMHVIRMSKTCQLLGQAIGMDERQSQILLNASPMHDIGKIGIPDRVLLKPGKLDPGEWEIMKTHTEIGAEILGSHTSDLMEMARVIAVTHHEKWDGSGYPRGLKGEDIPLVGRISAVADVFDALISERPYKDAWPVERAVALLEQESGAHFEPLLIEKFMIVLPQVLEIKEQFKDVNEERFHPFHRAGKEAGRDR
ncbi:HD-GYP domain-containing protein [Varunaivibrio sulfuroxidans]|uniref:Response regulator receiver modulated metal dependent phosphohydrolase n=1 Tax=Varunaivibrio sulfuroxidans TaxID=1773489 RepID=A0A4R3JHS7_9PROT|nr:HD domain-containing phosphohydrolase [Varunaivibrio sulfuroxidans]TCS64360.1 response regulator receiver modulated metal dependent phosphohydrolase [Varunaivibrio sulfuroxidans]WES31205.1 response regulator [Varunaivibrio sulfuroxidans]